MDLASLPTAAALAHGPAVTRWKPGLVGAWHSEVFGEGREASGAAVALALALDGLRSAGAEPEERSVLWVQDAASLKLTGRPYRPGLPPELRRRLIHVVAPKPEDALFAIEEGVRCRDLACVVGEIVGNPKALDFTASRRLSLAVERHGVPLFLVRLDAARDLSSARMRWQVRTAASPPPLWNSAAPGPASWHAELFRARGHAPGEWILTDDGQELVAQPAWQDAGTPDHGDLAGTAGDRSLAAF